MAAAVADWRPAALAERKLKKGDADRITIDLVKTPDVISGIYRDNLVKVGFAAETDDLVANARAKLVPKGLHLIAANDVTAEGSGFDSDTNEVVLLDRKGGMEELGLMSKYDVGHRILDRVVKLLK
jgi:phosphopantothenoylcysteine decarboxylase/phosphopantothenate--cysteine ligase